MLSHVWLFATPRTVRPPGSSDFPGKTTGVGYYFLLQGILWPRDQTHISYIGRRVHYHWATWKSCLTLCDPRDCSLPGSSVHGILQARILEWVAILFSRESSQGRDWTWVFCIAGIFFTIWATGKPNDLPGSFQVSSWSCASGHSLFPWSPSSFWENELLIKVFVMKTTLICDI